MKQQPKYPKITALRALMLLRELDKLPSEIRCLSAVSAVRDALNSHVSAHLISRRK
jgi:hypothetical protein